MIDIPDSSSVSSWPAELRDIVKLFAADAGYGSRPQTSILGGRLTISSPQNEVIILLTEPDGYLTVLKARFAHHEQRLISQFESLLLAVVRAYSYRGYEISALITPDMQTYKSRIVEVFPLPVEPGEASKAMTPLPYPSPAALGPASLPSAPISFIDGDSADFPSSKTLILLQDIDCLIPAYEVFTRAGAGSGKSRMIGWKKNARYYRCVSRSGGKYEDKACRVPPSWLERPVVEIVAGDRQPVRIVVGNISRKAKALLDV